MEYTTLGRTGVQVSKLCFGTMSFGGDADEPTSAAMFARCREAGINFFGNAGGTINGSVVNYSDTPMTLGGSGSLLFNRPDAGSVPAGFEPEIVLHYVASSYTEVSNL